MIGLFGRQGPAATPQMTQRRCTYLLDTIPCPRCAAFSEETTAATAQVKAKATADGESGRSIVHEGEDISLCHEATLIVTDDDIGVHARAPCSGA